MGSASGVCAFLWVKPRVSHSANDCCRVRPQPSFHHMIILNISGFHYKVSMHVKFSSPTVFIKLLAYILAKKKKGFIINSKIYFHRKSQRIPHGQENIPSMCKSIENIPSSHKNPYLASFDYIDRAFIYRPCWPQTHDNSPVSAFQV